MKRLFYLFSLVCLIVASCSPSKYAIQVEMRHPSRSGVQLADKVVSVVYLETYDDNANVFSEAIADGFAYALEQDYATGDGSIGIYRMRKQPGADYASRDSMFNLLIDTGSDVVFLLDTLKMGTMSLGGATRVASSPKDSMYRSIGAMPFSVTLHCFDAMDKSEVVKTFTGSDTARPSVYSDGEASSSELIRKAYAGLSEEGWNSGIVMSDPFKSQWKHEQYSVIYFDSDKWYRALEKADQYDWKGAMDLWISFLDTNDMLRKACAEYNISVACLMLGEYNLALQWLDRSDADNKLPISDTLRKRIVSRMQ